MYDAARLLRDAADGIVASIDEDDEFAIELVPGIDAIDEAFKSLSTWLKNQEETALAGSQQPQQTQTESNLNDDESV